MTGTLRPVDSFMRLVKTSAPLLLFDSPWLIGVMPLLLAGFVLFTAAGCAESVQDPSTDAQQAVQTPAMPAAPEAPELAATTEATEMSSEPASPSPEPVYLTSETTASMNLPFSDAVRVGHLLFLSGQIGNIPGTTDLAPGGIQGEARQTMENIRTVLEANGSSMDRVIKATVMLADIAEWPAFNEVYVTYFPGHKPARSAFAGSGLAFGARCEVEVIATVGE